MKKIEELTNLKISAEKRAEQQQNREVEDLHQNLKDKEKSITELRKKLLSNEEQMKKNTCKQF